MSSEQNIKNIKEILTAEEIIGAVIPDIEYEEVLLHLSGVLSENYNKILYISINTPYEKLASKFNGCCKELEHHSIDVDKFYFIDCITRTASDVSKISPERNCFFVSSPKALDEIQTAIRDILKKQKIDVALIDSPSSLLNYYEHIEVLRFMHLLMAELSVAGIKGIFPFMKESRGPLRRSIQMFTDMTVQFYHEETVLKMQVLK